MKVDRRLQQNIYDSKAFLILILLCSLQTSDLADGHETEANIIEAKASETLNKSNQALDTTKEAVDEQEKTTDGIEELLKKLNRTIALHEQAANDVKQARNDTKVALDDANALYKNGTTPLPDIGLPEMRGNPQFINTDF